MLTPGRCKKTKSGFCAVEVVWGATALAATWVEASAVSEAGTSGEGTTLDAPGEHQTIMAIRKRRLKWVNVFRSKKTGGL
jgi:hypothetical protein